MNVCGIERYATECVSLGAVFFLGPMPDLCKVRHWEQESVPRIPAITNERQRQNDYNEYDIQNETDYVQEPKILATCAGSVARGNVRHLFSTAGFPKCLQFMRKLQAAQKIVIL